MFPQVCWYSVIKKWGAEYRKVGYRIRKSGVSGTPILNQVIQVFTGTKSSNYRSLSRWKLCNSSNKTKERPLGEPATHTLEGATPLQTTQLQNGAPLRGGPASYARSQREGASAPPAPSPHKNKTYLMRMESDRRFQPPIRTVLESTKRPQGGATGLQGREVL